MSWNNFIFCTFFTIYSSTIYTLCKQFLFSELPLKVTRPLLDAQITEKDSVTLTCEVSKPNVKAKWKKDGVEIEPSEHYDISTKDNVHTLKINNAVIEDGAVYTCQVEDKETAAKIVVKGKHFQNIGHILTYIHRFLTMPIASIFIIMKINIKDVDAVNKTCVKLYKFNKIMKGFQCTGYTDL